LLLMFPVSSTRNMTNGTPFRVALGYMYVKSMKHFRTLALFAVILGSLAFPLLIGDSTITSMAVDTLLLMAAAVSWNIFSGYTGYISLGQATYFGLGAYSLAVACQDWNIADGYSTFLLVPVAGLVAGVVALPLGWIALRTRRYTFMMITIALFFIFQLLAYNLGGITGGSAGIFLPLPSWSSDFMNLAFYYVALALLLAVVFVSWWIRRSKFGLVLLAIRDDEDRAYGLGVSTAWFKLGAYVLSAAFAGMVGAASIYFAGLVTPSFAFDTTLNVNVVAATFLGGVGSVMGPIVGGLLFDPLQTYLTQQLGPAATGINQMLFGGLLLLVILLLPEGIVPSLSKRWQSWMSGRHKSVSREALQPQVDAAPVNTVSVDAAPVNTVSVDAAPINATPVSTVPEVSMEPVGSVAFQWMGAQNFTIAQRPSQSIMPLPLYHDEQGVFLPAFTGSLQRIKAQRLKPFSHGESILITQENTVDSSVMTTQEMMVDSSSVSWRCPRCRKPFLLKGNNCYCPRCGIIRSFSEAR
jgi:branched-chain amino acid transport system permease protein